MKTAIFRIDNVELLTESEIIEQFEAHAAISLNPHVTWMKFILTDARPNFNRQQIPREEFSNVIKTGIYMPIKMAQGSINEGHDEAIPVGVMTHLIEQDDEVMALAALWDREREADVAFLRERFREGKPIDVSWELSFADSEISDEGVEIFSGVSVNAATIVGMPAYGGRTSVEGLAALKKEARNNANLEDTDTMDTISLDKHEELLTAQREGLEGKLGELETQLEASQTELDELKSGSEAANTELKDLRTFKEGVEAVNERNEKLATIRTAFEEAGLEVVDEYFSDREDTFAEMSDDQIEFFIQELVAFEKSTDDDDPDARASVYLTSRTPLTRKANDDALTSDDIVKHLRSLDTE